MKITTILFDLDGTLLPMDNEKFTKEYFKLLCKKLVPLGFEKDKLVSAVWKGTGAMVQNNGSASNYDVFWKTFSDILGEQVQDSKHLFDEFYENEFNNARETCGFNVKSAKLIETIKSKGLRVVLASNPIFPLTAQKARVRWAGVDPDDFEHITAYENCSYCKPNPEYYKEILAKIGVKPDECLMIGNDVDEDMVALSIGLSVFLLTDNIINLKGMDISAYPHGSFEQLENYIENLK